MDVSAINISGPISMLGKGPLGYYTSNDIFEQQENISSRYQFRASAIEEVYYLIFSLRENYDVCYVSLRLEKKEFDIRDSNHIELFDMSLNSKPEFNDTAPHALKAICRQSRGFFADETDIVETLFYLSPYIPIQLKERIIFSFDDKSDDVVALSKGKNIVINKIEDYYIKYCRNPQQYYELFKENIDNLYLKGYYSEGPAICLKNAVKDIDEKIAKEEKLKKDAEEREKAEKKRLEEQQLKMQEAQQNRIEKPNGEIFLMPENIGTGSEKNAVVAESRNIYSSSLRGYPKNPKFFQNPLYVCCLVNYGWRRNIVSFSHEAWKASTFEQISSFADNIKECPEMINYIEPDLDTDWYCLYKGIVGYLHNISSEIGPFLAMRFWINAADIKEFLEHGLNCEDEMEKFAKKFLYQPIYEKDNFLQKQSKITCNNKIWLKIQKKIRMAKKIERKV